MIVLFLSNCDKTDRCEEILSDLEEIDEQLEDMGILFVYTDDETYAAKLKITTFPTIAYFRNGDRLMYEGSIENEMAVLRFATDLHNIRIPGKIVEVGVSLLEFFMEERKDVFAFLYEEDDGRAKKILQRLEAIDDNLVRLCKHHMRNLIRTQIEKNLVNQPFFVAAPEEAWQDCSLQ